MSIILLLRFRDLVVPETGFTIAEHQKICNAYGYTWWGWWRKQSEAIPEQLWSELRRQVEGDDKFARAYLLDSGQRVLYRAKLLDVTFEPGRDGVPVPELGAKTPDYYQRLDSAVLFASWFKLAEIEEADPSDLTRLAYRSSPHDDLLRVPDEKIVGRRIAGIEELLMFGNVTYWVATPAQADAVEVGPLHVSVRPPVSTDVVVAQSNRILHLSDLHLGAHHAYEAVSADVQNPSLAQAVLEAMREGRSPGLVVVTGDLTWTGSEQEFELAYKCLDTLRSTLGLTTQHFVLIPGNHDLGWVPAGEQGEGAPTRYTLANTDARENYEKFFRRWYGTPPRSDLAVGRRFFLLGGPTLDILGLNSAALQQLEGAFQGLGRVPEAYYLDAARVLGWDNVRASQLRVVLTHHHILPVVSHERPEDSSSGFGIALDAGSQLRLAQDFAVDLAIHGHQHHPFAAAIHTVDFIGTRTPARGSLLVLGGGTAGVEDQHVGPFKHRAFNLIEMRLDHIRVELFATHLSNRFEHLSTISGEPGALWSRVSNNG